MKGLGPRFAVMGRAHRALAVDPVLSDAQLQRLDAWHPDLPGRTVVVQTRANNFSSMREVTFRSLDKKLLSGHTGAQLAHVAGTAEVRLALGLSSDGWRNTAHRGAAELQPDGVFEQGSRRVLVEYDSGRYEAGTVRRKMRAFVQQGEVVWGVTIPLRAQRLQQRYPYARVLTVDWWSTP